MATKKTSQAKKTRKKKPRGTCFTIMPFGGWFDNYYSSVFCQAIEATGLKPKRADDLYRPSTIVADIWALTKEAKIIIADMSGKNPNVFYELGLAHALGKPVILVANSMEDVPFDLRALRVLEYDKNAHNWGELLTGKITKAIKEVLKDPSQSVPAAFIETDITVNRPKLSEEAKTIMVMQRQINALSREIRSHDDEDEQIEPGEAEFLIRRYLASGAPKSRIVRIVSMKGAPEDWVRDRIEEVLEEDEEEEELQIIKPSITRSILHDAQKRKASKKKATTKKVARRRATKKAARRRATKKAARRRK